MQVKHAYDKARQKLQWRIRQLEQTKRDKLTPEKKRKRSDSKENETAKSKVILFRYHASDVDVIYADQSGETFEISSDKFGEYIFGARGPNSRPSSCSSHSSGSEKEAYGVGQAKNQRKEGREE